jgi:hypothetical protein
MPVIAALERPIPELGRPRQEDHKFKASLEQHSKTLFQKIMYGHGGSCL